MAGAELTRSATEQPDVDMDSRLAVPADPLQSQPVSLGRQLIRQLIRGPTGSATEQTSLAVPAGPAAGSLAGGTSPQVKWEIQVDFNNDYWWAMPQELSEGILEQWQQGSQQVSFIWDWKTSRPGSYRPGGVQTSINRYMIDFDTMYQRNLDNNRIRKVQVVGVLR